MSNTIYDIDFDKAAVQLLPPDKRFTNNISWVRCLLTPLQYIRDLWFGTYRTGNDAPLWTGSYPYNKYDEVLYIKTVYESLVDNNTAPPTDIKRWKVKQLNFIGIQERLKYNGQKLVLEYAMNKWFGTTFRQPNNLSDIYIITNSIVIPAFRVGLTETISSTIATDKSSEFIGLGGNYSVASNFTIYCPVAVYNALDPTMTNNEKIFRAFVDRYKPAGVTYTISTY